MAPAAERKSRALGTGFDEAIAGSNSWVVSGALTKSGKPLLANDPHLGLAVPSIWLPMRFEIAGRLVEGVTLPGLPGVVLGRNDALAWGFTNLYTDVQDLYRETIVDGKAARRAAPSRSRFAWRRSRFAEPLPSGWKSGRRRTAPS